MKNTTMILDCGFWSTRHTWLGKRSQIHLCGSMELVSKDQIEPKANANAIVAGAGKTILL